MNVFKAQPAVWLDSAVLLSGPAGLAEDGKQILSLRLIVVTTSAAALLSILSLL